jgi:hypothetical protein
MPLRIFLRGVELNGDGDTSNVRFEIFDMKTRLSLPMTFTVKERNSLDHAVRDALGELRSFASELRSVLASENPLDQKTTRQ